MALQNRVTPCGELIAVNARGAFMGNRGILHDAEKKIVKHWRHKAWVTCSLQYQGIRRSIFSPNHYSELFFLDEVTALSAGHRPCGDCRRERFKEFKHYWQLANADLIEGTSLSVAQIDKQMHIERIAPDGSKLKHEARWDTLPNGVFFAIENRAYLKWNAKVFEWSPAGYLAVDISYAPEDLVKVLTPKSVVAAIAAGFVPQVHASATELL